MLYGNNELSSVEYGGFRYSSLIPDPIRETVSLIGRITTDVLSGKIEKQNKTRGDTAKILELRGKITEQ